MIHCPSGGRGRGGEEQDGRLANRVYCINMGNWSPRDPFPGAMLRWTGTGRVPSADTAVGSSVNRVSRMQSRSCSCRGCRQPQSPHRRFLFCHTGRGAHLVSGAGLERRRTGDRGPGEGPRCHLIKAGQIKVLDFELRVLGCSLGCSRRARWGVLVLFQPHRRCHDRLRPTRPPASTEAQAAVTAPHKLASVLPYLPLGLLASGHGPRSDHLTTLAGGCTSRCRVPQLLLRSRPMHSEKSDNHVRPV